MGEVVHRESQLPPTEDKMPLYHKDIGLPKVSLPTGQFTLDYSSHAREEAVVDRYGNIKLPRVIDTSKAEVIEVETDTSGKVSKVLYRMQLDERRDICMPVIPRGLKLFVKTVWVNLRSDRHKTLDRSKYAKPAAK